jgi:hypothetical protein
LKGTIGSLDRTAAHVHRSAAAANCAGLALLSSSFFSAFSFIFAHCAEVIEIIKKKRCASGVAAVRAGVK